MIIPSVALDPEELKAFETQLRLGLDIHTAASWRIDARTEYPGKAHLFISFPSCPQDSTCGSVLLMDSVDYESHVLQLAGDQMKRPHEVNLLWCSECLDDAHRLARLEDPDNEIALFGIEVP